MSETKAVKLKTLIEKVVTYRNFMNDVFNYVNDPEHNDPPATKIEPDQQYLQFYIDKPAMGRLARICDSGSCEQIAVFFGMEGDHNKMTACFVGIDPNGQIIPGHFVTKNKKDRVNDVDPEENWPPPPPIGKKLSNRSKTKQAPGCFTIQVSETDLRKYFLGKYK